MNLKLWRRLPLPQSALEHVSHALLPPCCVSCRTPIIEKQQLCSDCWQKLHFTSHASCQRCGFTHAFATGHYCASCLVAPPLWQNFASALVYDEASARMIIQYKYNSRFALLPLFTRWMLLAGRTLDAPNAIVPVPLHPIRQWWRRYNQSAILAQRLAKELKQPKLFQPMWIARSGSMRSLRGKSATERAKLMNEVFYWRSIKNGAFKNGAHQKSSNHVPYCLKGKHVWLIDDVATTGATLNSLSQKFIEQGASVSALVLARVSGQFAHF